MGAHDAERPVGGPFTLEQHPTFELARPIERIAPTDVIDSAVRRVTGLREQRRLSLFPIGIGEDADMERLRQFSPDRPPLRLQGLKFSEFFEWLSKSVSRVSQSIPGEEVPLDVDGLQGWATV